MTEATLPEVRETQPSRNPYVGCSFLALERLPVPFPLLVIIFGGYALAEQLVEYQTSDAALRLPIREAMAQGGVIVIMILYILIYLRILKGRSVSGLERLRPAVKISDEEFQLHARRMLNASPLVESILLIASIGVVALLFMGGEGGSTINRPDQPLPDSLLLALFMASAYVLLGWLLLSVVYTSVRYARELRALATKPLEVNIFDPMNLLPFGDLSLMHSLSAAGLFVIPMILNGPPTRAGYLVFGISLISLAALFIPLYGVHRQMDNAREQALDQIYVRLMKAHDSLLGSTNLPSDELADLTNRTSLLVSLRDLVMKSPSWPFRDVASLLRASLAVASPFIVYILQRLIDAYVTPLLIHVPP